MLFSFFRQQLPGQFFLGKGKPVAFHPVIGRETLYRQFFIVEQGSRFGDVMDMEGETKLGIGHFELHFDDLPEGGGAKYMQYLLVAEQAQGINQSDESEIMVTVQVGNKNMGDPAPADFVPDQLDLGTFPAIDEVVGAIKSHHLAGRVTIESGYGRIISQNSDGKHG